MLGQNIGYTRVSTAEQSTLRQLHGLQLDIVFEDNISGSVKQRPGLDSLLAHIRTGDVVHVHDISRLARNTGHLLSLVELFLSKGVSLHFHRENLVFTADSSSPMNQLLLTLLGAIYQFERAMIRERQAEGIALAKMRGVYKGRKSTIDKDKIKQCRDMGLSYRDIARELDISLSSVQRALKKP
ncbi:recombinase family protein [Agarivorans sp. TSD2052]|uniref:recombinase family protein n=1 Tax=Agarivorans sp. TSD2052 TaxID=2937286 RepID=UPI00200C2DC9|nr:recombinase family protein [Agarivorans sp. TSD2052]UPW18080.1 recombinase family protein [Agarivorans sp. TSD2052]